MLGSLGSKEVVTKLNRPCCVLKLFDLIPLKALGGDNGFFLLLSYFKSIL